MMGREQNAYKGIDMEIFEESQDDKLKEELELCTINLNDFPDEGSSTSSSNGDNNTPKKLIYWLLIGPLSLMGIIIIILEIIVVVMLVIGAKEVIKMKSSSWVSTSSSSYAGLKGMFDRNCKTISSEAHVNGMYPASSLPQPPGKLEDICSLKRLKHCKEMCEPAACCRTSAQNQCHDIISLRCTDYEPCNVLNKYDDDPADGLPDDTKSLAAQLCTLEYISTEEGRLMCETACQPAQCCYNKRMNCSLLQQKQHICEEYESCMILGITAEIMKKKDNTKKKDRTASRKDDDGKNENEQASIMNKKEMEIMKKDKTKKNRNKDAKRENKILQEKIDFSCSNSRLQILYLKRFCNQLCIPGQCCFTRDKCPKNVDKTSFCLPYETCEDLRSQPKVQFQKVENTPQKQKQVSSQAQQIDEACFDIKNNPQNEATCQTLCQNHMCCVDSNSNNQLGCSANNDELLYCQDYLLCSNLLPQTNNKEQTSTNQNSNKNDFYFKKKERTSFYNIMEQSEQIAQEDIKLDALDNDINEAYDYQIYNDDYFYFNIENYYDTLEQQEEGTNNIIYSNDGRKDDD